jgi:hypothetical protein
MGMPVSWSIRQITLVGALPDISSSMLIGRFAFFQLSSSIQTKHISVKNMSKTVRIVQMMSSEYKQTILDRIKVHSHDDDDMGCRLWDRSVRTGDYPRMKMTVEGDRSDQAVHRLVYFLSGKADIHRHQVSHLCHKKLCICLAHLSLELPHVNKQRDNCKKEGRCFEHGDLAKCIVMYFICSSRMLVITVFITNYKIALI